MLIGRVAKRDFGVLWSRSFCLKISKSNLNFPTPDDDIWQRTFGGPSEVKSNEIGVLHRLLNIIASMTVSLYYTDENSSKCVCVLTWPLIPNAGLFCFVFLHPSSFPIGENFSLVIFTVTCFTVCHVCGHTIFVWSSLKFSWHSTRSASWYPSEYQRYIRWKEEENEIKPKISPILWSRTLSRV